MNTQLIKLTQDTLFKTQQKMEELDLQLKAIYEKEKTDKDNWRKYWDEKNNIREELKQLKELELHQKNQVICLENEGELTTITDKKGKKHEHIPDFRNTDTEKIQFEIDEILTAKLPPYIPVIDEEKFRSKGYVFDAIRIDKDSYILATSEHSEEKQTYYVIVTLDQLVLTQDYYYTKAKAQKIKDAQESDIRQEKYWDSLPEERRQRFLNQQDLYHSLPVKIKKTITQEDYEALTWQEKEKIYKFFKRSRPKKLKSQLSSTTMWGSYHRMYERFVNPEAVMPKPRYANKEVWEYWAVFRDMMEYKMKDIAIQRAELSEIRQKAIETSFGEINTSLALKKQYGVLVKRQNGDKINLMEIEQIKDALVSVQKIFGSIKQIAEKTNLKISHTGTRYVFASKAAGMYVPSMGTIAVSDKFGNHQFKMTMAHEIAHFIDNYIGSLNEKRYLTDDYESTAGKVAFTFRKYLNGNKATLSDYTKSTKECFARALEMYYGIETIGETAGVLYSDEPLNEYKTFYIADDFVNKENYTNHIKPLIEQFFKEQKDVLIYGEDIDESNNPISVGKEVGGETFAEVESNLHKLIEVATTKEDKQQINEAIKVMELMQELENKEFENECSIGETKIHKTKVVDGEYIETKSEKIIGFTSAFELKKYVDNIQGKKSMISVDTQTSYGFKTNFGIPEWHYNSEGRKLFFKYDKKNEKCPYYFTELTQERKKAEKPKLENGGETKNIGMQKEIEEFKEKIEKNLGKKVTVRLSPITSAMKGYVTFTPKKEKGNWVDFDINDVREFAKGKEGKEPNPNFFTKSRIDYYFGIGIYDRPKREVRPKNEAKKLPSKIGNVNIPLNKRNKNYFIGWTTDLGRGKSIGDGKMRKGSGGWGYAPNVNHLLLELNKENLEQYTSGVPNDILITLGDSTRVKLNELKEQFSPDNINIEDLKKRLEIVKKMAQKNPSLNSRVKIIEKMIEKNKLEKGGQVHEFGCIMLGLDNSILNKLQDRIEEKDLYIDENDGTYGKVKNAHITLLYGIHKEVPDKEVVKKVKEIVLPQVVHANNISLFESEKYDVLKLDVNEPILHKINQELQKLPHTNAYKEYHPHLTVAYIKKGLGKKYVEKLKSLPFPLPLSSSQYEKNIIYSKTDGTELKINN